MMDTLTLTVVIIGAIVGGTVIALLLWLCWYWCKRGRLGEDTHRLLYEGNDPRYGSREEQNYRFYANKIKVKPKGWSVNDMIFELQGDYTELETNHSYIQWLFPTMEQGMNYDAKPLTRMEADRIKSNPMAKSRLVKAYSVMLDFFGLRLIDEETGVVDRAMDARFVQERFDNMERHTHNYRRVTRIIKSLGILGYEHYQTPLVRQLSAEILVNKQLPSGRTSLRDYWIPAIINYSDREELEQYFKSF